MVPAALQQRVAIQHGAVGQREHLQQRELLGRQRHDGPVSAHPAAAAIDLEATDADHRPGRDRRPAQQGLHPRHELGAGERLDHVVVGARAEPDHDGLRAVQRGQDEQRHRPLLRAPLGAQLEPVPVGQPAVHDGQRVVVSSRQQPGLGRRGGHVDGVAGGAQGVRHGRGDLRLVLDHE